VPRIASTTHSFAEDEILKQTVLWWQEAEIAAQAGQVPRARRFLRWILIAQPEDEDAWLRLADLASSQEAQWAYLRQAYTFHPESRQVQSALRSARSRQLESAARELEHHPMGVRRLPGMANGNSTERKKRSRKPSLGQRFREIAASSSPLSRPRVWPQALKSAPVWLAFLVPLLVYLLTACSTVYSLDSAEFSAAAHVLGIVRATGYPLYLLLGKTFTLLLPVGDVAFRLNVMSGLCAAGTVALLYRLLWRLTRQRAAALAASFLFAFSYYFWAQAVVAEVYALHTLLMAALLLLLLRWETSQSDSLLAASALLYGLSFGNHMSTILLAPGFALFLLAVKGRALVRPSKLLSLLLPFLVGISIYLYLPLRYQAQPAFNYAGHYNAEGQFVALDLTQPANVWWLVSGQGFRALMFDYTPAELVNEVRQVAYWLWGNFLGIGLIPGLIGAWVELRKKPRHLVLLGSIFVANLAFFTNYRVIDKAMMFVPAYLVWAVWVGEGFAWLVGWVQGQRRAHTPSPVWAWALTALAIVALAVNWPLVNVHNDTRARDRAEAALAQASQSAIILGWWTSAPPIQYLQLVEHRRPDVQVINRFLIGADEMYALIDHSLGTRSVYVMELDEGLINAYQTVPVGPMFELVPREIAKAEP
jgi:4-amino-4-deoxy-L-arabinose transferase-like glycosyltransferase